LDNNVCLSNLQCCLLSQFISLTGLGRLDEGKLCICLNLCISVDYTTDKFVVLESMHISAMSTIGTHSLQINGPEPIMQASELRQVFFQGPHLRFHQG